MNDHDNVLDKMVVSEMFAFIINKSLNKDLCPMVHIIGRSPVKGATLGCNKPSGIIQPAFSKPK